MFIRFRRLEALTPLRYDRADLQPGDIFYAADIDARYFITRNRAKEAPEPEIPADPASVNPNALDVSAFVQPLDATGEAATDATGEAATDATGEASDLEEPASAPSRRRRRRSPTQSTEGGR